MEETKDVIKYLASVLGASVFVLAAYQLPAETFIAFFSAVLFIIPTAIFLYMIQAMTSRKEKDEQN